MRTTIDLDDRLLATAVRVTGLATKKAVVEAALRLLVETRAQASIRKFRGKVAWHGDLDSSRISRTR